MTLKNGKPADLPTALDLVRDHVDHWHAKGLRSMANTSSGVLQPKTRQAQVTALSTLEALLQLLGDLDPRFGVTDSLLRSESYQRINGAQIVAVDQAKRGQYEELRQARRSA